MKPFMFLALAAFILIGVTIFGYSMQANDYEVSQINGTPGEDTNTTAQTISNVDMNYTWWGAVAILIILLALVAVFKMF
jgi:hypothetical protein